MPKQVSHAALDAAFKHIADRADFLVLCEGAPASYADAHSLKSAGGKRLGGIAMATGLDAGDYAVAAGDVSGRKLVVSEQTGVPIAEAGAIDHVALLDTAAAELMLTTTLSAPTAVIAEASIVVDSFADEIGDPL